MTIPQPAVPLTDACSVIFNNTLYTYSSGAFQSLALEPGAQWKQLSQGVSVTGAACVGSTPVAPREPGFFVVGGTGPADYNGLQKYTYSTGTWETLSPVSTDIKGRKWHGATYINSTDAILVYAGNQDGTKQASTQTFTVGASAPFDVLSYESSGTPATTNPMLLPWSETQAVLIGGSETNTKVMLFSPGVGWTDSGATLAVPLTKDISTVRAAVIPGDDGSKSLYTLDMSQSPNLVSRMVLINGQGQPVQNSKSISKRSRDGDVVEARLARRLTSDQWPTYNSTNAPTATRTNFSVAQDSNGRVVVAGGNTDDVLCVFDGRENSWLNASSLFTEQQTLRSQDITSSSSSVSSTSSTATASATSTTSATSLAVSSATSTQTTSASPQPTVAVGSASGSSSESNESSGPSINTILAAVLGTTGAVLIILGVLYCLLRRKERRAQFLEAGHNRRASGASSSEKGGIGLTTESLRSPTTGVFRGGHQQQDSQASFSSMAILMGRLNQQKQTGIERQPSKESKRSSASSILNNAFKKSISKPITRPQDSNPFMDPPPRVPQSQTREEKGVAFSQDVAEPRPRQARPEGSDAPDGTRRSSGWNRYWSGGSTLNILGFGSGASKRTSDASSRYSSTHPHRITQDSATVPHLNVGRMGEPKPEFNRVNSGSPTISHYTPPVKGEMKGRIERPTSAASGSSGYSSGIPASVHEVWDPTTTGQPWGANRAPSSGYNSGYNSAYNSIYSTALAPPALPASGPSKSPTPSGISTQPQLAMAATSSDMSWLNLGDNSRRA